MEKIYIFDCDGVISDLKTKEANRQVLEKISEILKNGNVVIFNTGRSFGWVRDNIVNKLEIKNKEKIFISAEFGGVIAKFDEAGNLLKTIDTKIQKSEGLTKKIENLINEKYNKSTIFDKKDTMVSLEMRDGFSLEDYKQILSEIKKDIHNILEGETKTVDWEVVENPIAIDVRDPILDKRYGTKKVIEWLREKGFEGDYVVFGDQPSDLEIGEELLKEGTKPTFVFVGEDEVKNSDLNLVITNQKYTLGTLEYLL